MSYDIPFEIQVEIIKWLPFSSLARSKSVSKAWNSLIHSSEFMTDYTSCQPQFLTCNYKKKQMSVVDDDTLPLRKLSPPNPKAIAPKLIKMSYYIPFEIQAEIIKRLPVKSLIQFTSVSKHWKSFIYSSKFITDYKAFRPQHCLLVTCRDDNYFEKKHVLIVDDDTFSLHNLSHTIPSSVDLFTKHICTFGSSQGLFCFYGYIDHGDPWSDQMAMVHGYPVAMDQVDPMAVIWNPSIRKSVDINMSSKYDWSMYNTVVGFGVCPSTFDVKLVKITYIKDDDPSYDGTQVEVFTLSSGAWKSLSINLPRESIRFTQDYSMDLDGFIYWLAIDHDSDVEGETEGHNMIMSFDMRSENFIEISLPHSLVDADYTHLSISKWMESLIVLEYNLRARKLDYNVWMMKDGVQKSFTKLFTIEAPEAPIRRVLGFRKSGEPITTMHNKGYEYSSGPDELGVYHYEPNSRHISYIRICTDWWDSHLASSYTDTLLLLE